MVDTDSVGHVVHGGLTEAVLILVKVQNHVLQRGVKHLPTTLAHRRCNGNNALKMGRIPCCLADNSNEGGKNRF